MKNNFIKKGHYIVLSSILLFGCSQKNNNIDFDPSDLPKPKAIYIPKKNNIDRVQTEDKTKTIIADLVPLKDKKQILSRFEFGKNDPFSEGEIQLNKLNSEFKLVGFIATNNNKYAFVNHLDKEGTLTEESVGGVNTYLLPDGAKVINIDPKNEKLTIFYENKKFIFEL